jgi:hypothetical protein
VLRSWLLVNELKRVRSDYVTKSDRAGKLLYAHLQQVKGVPVPTSQRTFLEYGHATMVQLLKATLPADGSVGTGDWRGLEDVFQWDGSCFRSEQAEGLGHPTTIVSDGDHVHFRFERLVTRPRFKDGVHIRPKVYKWHSHYAIERTPRDPKILRSVADVLSAGYVGAVDVDDLAEDMHTLPQDTLDGNSDLRKAVTKLREDVQECLGVDPGYTYPATLSDGRGVPLHLCYQRRNARPPPQAVQDNLDAMRNCSLHVDSLQTLQTNVPRWIAGHSAAVDYYARNTACSERAVRAADRKALIERVARDILTKSDGTTYKVVAWGYNYRGGNTVRGVKSAGPSIVKAVLRELCRRALVLLGTQCFAENVVVALCTPLAHAVACFLDAFVSGRVHDEPALRVRRAAGDVLEIHGAMLQPVRAGETARPQLRDVDARHRGQPTRVRHPAKGSPAAG